MTPHARAAHEEAASSWEEAKWPNIHQLIADKAHSLLSRRAAS